MGDHIVILLGPPASGKGTQAHELEKRYGWRAFSTGAAIRSHVQRGTPFGKRFESMLGSAYLLPDQVVMELVREELGSHHGGLVLDGYPRTVPQAELFDAYCTGRGWSVSAVLAILASRDELEARVLHRLTCLGCGSTCRDDDGHGMSVGSPCPRCGGALSRRKDDQPGVFAERFAEYDSLTAPLLDYYAGRGIVHRFHALTPAPELAGQIFHICDQLP